MAPLQQLGEVAVGAEVGQRAVGVDPGLDPLEVEVDRHAVEKGEPGVSLGAYATVLFVLGFAERLGDLADPGTDELVDVLRRYGAAPKEDLHALWRRIVFNVLISNTDDHLRNHAFLYSGPDGWRLAPAYDLDPVPVDIKPRVLTTAIDLDDGSASLDLVRGVAAYFELDDREAQAIALEVGQAVAAWRQVAGRHSLPEAEIDRMASAFEHEDSVAARELRR